MGATKLDTSVRKVGMTEARTRLPELTEVVASGRAEAIELLRRNVPETILVQHARFSPLLRAVSEASNDARPERVRSLLAWAVTDLWLGRAPSHLRDPQATELESLEPEALLALLLVEPADAEPSRLEAKGVSPGVLARLSKRSKVSAALREADDENLFEAAEHAASRVLEQAADAK